MSNYLPPVVKITTRHANGGISMFHADEARDLGDREPVKEAIINVFANVAGQGRAPVIRSDMEGSDWETLRKANAIHEMKARLEKSAKDLESGASPTVIVRIDDKGAMHDANLLTNEFEVKAALAVDPSRRSLEVPKDLPFQFGGTAKGATALIYQPQPGRKILVHSLHPNEQEAALAENYLRSQGQTRIGTLQVQTPVTSLLRDVLSNAYRPTTPNLGDAHLAELNDAKPAKPKSPFSLPEAFARPTPMTAN